MQAQALLDAGHPSTTIIPLTTRLMENASPLRIRVSVQGRLRQRSDLLLDQVRSIDNRRLVVGPLCRLSSGAMTAVALALQEVLGIEEHD